MISFEWDSKGLIEKKKESTDAIKSSEWMLTAWHREISLIINMVGRIHIFFSILFAMRSKRHSASSTNSSMSISIKTMDSQHSVIDFSSEIVINSIISRDSNEQKLHRQFNYYISSSQHRYIRPFDFPIERLVSDMKWPSTGQSNYTDRKWHRQLSDITISLQLFRERNKIV